MREEPRRGRGDDGILARPGRRELSVLAGLLEALVSFFLFSFVSVEESAGRKKGGGSDIKDAAVRTRPDAGRGSTKEQESRPETEMDGGAGQEICWSLQKGGTGTASGSHCWPIAGFQCGHETNVIPQQQPSEPATEPPPPPTRDVLSCWSSQLCWRVAAKGKDEKWRPRDWHEIGARAESSEQSIHHPRSVRGRDTGKLGSWEVGSPSTPPWAPPTTPS